MKKLIAIMLLVPMISFADLLIIFYPKSLKPLEKDAAKSVVDVASKTINSNVRVVDIDIDLPEWVDSHSVTGNLTAINTDALPAMKSLITSADKAVVFNVKSYEALLKLGYKPNEPDIYKDILIPK